MALCRVSDFVNIMWLFIGFFPFQWIQWNLWVRNISE